MRTILTITSAAVLALTAVSGAAALNVDAQDKGRGGEQGKGNGNGNGNNGKGRGGDDDRGRERGPQREARGPERAERGNDNRGRGDDDRWEGRRELERAPVRAEVRDIIRRDDRRDDRDGYRDVRVVETLILGRTPDRGLIQGCPPGLAKKDNGCLPPGQARRIAQSRYDYLWDRRDDDYRYRYDNGYLYRTNQQGGLLGYLPLLGGALGLGQVWPTQYNYQPAPDYHTRYYGLQDQYDYRYADGVIYGLDPQTQSISQVAALLTGQSWNVGQRMPSGYDVYNVPYQYRDQYVDGPDRRYRYDDGYVYQVDPTTQLVQAAIQLVT